MTLFPIIPPAKTASRYRYWRWSFSSSTGAASDVILKEVTLEIGGVDQIPVMTGPTTAGVTMSGSSTSSQAYLAGDDNVVSFFQPGGGMPCWYKVDFGPGNAKHIEQYKLINHSAAHYAPTAWTLGGSSDDVSYTIVDSRSGVSWSTDVETKNFVIPAY